MQLEWKKKRECSVQRRSSRTLHQLLTRDRVSRRRNPLRFSLLGTTPYSSAHNCDGREWWEREAFFLRSPHAHTISHESIIALVALVALKNCEESQESAQEYRHADYLSRRKGQIKRGKKKKFLRHEDRRHVRQEEQRALRDSSRIGSYRGHDGNAPASET